MPHSACYTCEPKKCEPQCDYEAVKARVEAVQAVSGGCPCGDMPVAKPPMPPPVKSQAPAPCHSVAAKVAGMSMHRMTVAGGSAGGMSSSGGLLGGVIGGGGAPLPPLPVTPTKVLEYVGIALAVLGGLGIAAGVIGAVVGKKSRRN